MVRKNKKMPEIHNRFMWNVNTDLAIKNPNELVHI